jgi:hypothetical protein
MNIAFGFGTNFPTIEEYVTLWFYDIFIRKQNLKYFE